MGPTGSLTFYDGTMICASPLSGEIATLPVDNLPVGMDAIKPRTAATPSSNRARLRLWM